MEELIARLDKQAAAIRDLRKRVAALEGSGPINQPVSEHSDIGTYKHNPKCAMCGNDKEPGRRTLTCKACSAIRTDAIKAGDQSKIKRSACFSCGASFKPCSRILCIQCSKGFAAWKASQ